MDLSSFRSLFARPRPESQNVQFKADAGEANAQFDLGGNFADGVGVGQDFLQAAHWYERAADQDHPMAEFRLGLLFASGQGVARDELRASDLFRKAAGHGNAGAQYYLGVGQQKAGYQVRGAAAMECKVESYKWFRLASAQGYPGSVEAFEQVALVLTREQVVDGNQRADLYQTTITRSSNI